MDEAFLSKLISNIDIALPLGKNEDMSCFLPLLYDVIIRQELHSFYILEDVFYRV